MLRSLVGSEMCIRDSINAEYGDDSCSRMAQESSVKVAMEEVPDEKGELGYVMEEEGEDHSRIVSADPWESELESRTWKFRSECFSLVRSGLNVPAVTFVLGVLCCLVVLWIISLGGSDTNSSSPDTNSSSPDTNPSSGPCGESASECSGCPELMAFPILSGTINAPTNLFFQGDLLCTAGWGVTEVSQPVLLSSEQVEDALVVEPTLKSGATPPLEVVAERVCVLPWGNANIAHWTFDNLINIAGCYRSGASAIGVGWNTHMRPWHLELLQHAFTGQIVLIVPKPSPGQGSSRSSHAVTSSNVTLVSSPIVAVHGVLVPCFGGANDFPPAWMWRTGQDSCTDNDARRERGYLWTVMDQMRQSLISAGEELTSLVPAAGALLFAKRTNSASARECLNVPQKALVLQSAGYTEWDPLSFNSFAARVPSLRNAQRLVLETGSDMIQALFMPIGSTVVMLANPLMYDKVAFAKAFAIGLGLKFAICDGTVNLEFGYKEEIVVRAGHRVTYVDPADHTEKSELLTSARAFSVANVKTVDNTSVTQDLVRSLVTINSLDDETKWGLSEYWHLRSNSLGMSLIAYTVSYSFNVTAIRTCLDHFDAAS
eukprot:TRINITY_DN5090_c0_g1_i1.p1 TRINITY_DN5090_c0_g1~~TRINITY_DN5090_c0_g1_i1.p1  ORF type:complete len:616 (+),score=112.86 TRINITY_DN5090_c0_g1_i1:46-1848(+)